MDFLWPGEPSPSSYFGLVKWFIRVVPHITTIKRSACIEGARMALARVKAYWTDMDATMVASQDLVGGQYPTGHCASIRRAPSVTCAK